MTEIQATDYFWPWAEEQLPGDPAADPEHPPCCHPGQDEVVEDEVIEDKVAEDEVVELTNMANLTFYWFKKEKCLCLLGTVSEI